MHRAGGSRLKASPGKQFVRPYLKKPSQKGPVEWLKVQAISSSPVLKQTNKQTKD
jgi:hypothetical protein